MRKLLLASAAMLGATVGVASAQLTANPSQGQLAAPNFPVSGANDLNNANGQPDTYVGNKIGLVPIIAPQPGTVVVKLGAKVEVDFDGFWTNLNTAQAAPGVPAGSAKLNPLAIAGYMRLYPSVDGMATNGLRYGASIELRENFPGSAAQQTPLLVPAPSGSTYSSGETVFVRRAYAYVASDNLGLVRIGQTDGVIGLFDPCIFSGQCYDAGTGNFNGGNYQGTGPSGAVSVPFVWLAQAGAEYGNSKIVYLSPQFFGVDFGVQYAPSMNNGYSACGIAAIGGAAPAQAGTSCEEATTGADPTRWYNQVAIGARYQGVFGPVGVGAYVVYETAGKEDFFGPASAFRNGGGTTAGVAGNQFDNLSFVAAAAYLNFDTGFGVVTPAFDYIGGALNGQLAMRPTGGVPEEGFLPSLKYTNGPLAMEIEAGLINSQGSNTLVGVSQRRELEVAFGGSYVVAPGLFLTAEYMHMQRHQGGFDFATGANGAGATGVPGTSSWKAGLTRDTSANGFLTAITVAW